MQISQENLDRNRAATEAAGRVLFFPGWSSLSERLLPVISELSKGFESTCDCELGCIELTWRAGPGHCDGMPRSFQI